VVTVGLVDSPSSLDDSGAPIRLSAVVVLLMVLSYTDLNGHWEDIMSMIGPMMRMAHFGGGGYGRRHKRRY
jgi:hypothetical protein